MITEDQIKAEIGKLQVEQASLQVQHDQMVRNFQQMQAEFQQRVAANQNRFQQITGAMANLQALLQPPGQPSQNGQPSAPRKRINKPQPAAAETPLPRQ